MRELTAETPTLMSAFLLAEFWATMHLNKCMPPSLLQTPPPPSNPGPPGSDAVLPTIVLLMTVTAPVSPAMPLPELLLVMMQWSRSSMPSVWMVGRPPADGSVIVRPEILAVAPGLIAKMPAAPLVRVMVRLAAPGPVIVKL